MMDFVNNLLLHTLEEMTSSELKRFQWYLRQDIVDGFRPIRTAYLENADRLDTVDLMVIAYCTDGALRITIKILEKMNLNRLADNLCASRKDRPDTEGESPVAGRAAVAVVDPDKDDDPHKQAVEKVLQFLKSCQPEDALKIIKKVHRELNLDEVRKYVVSSKPRGICLILNNVDFKNVKHLKDRPGSDIDAEALARVFSWLGIWVVMCKDKTKKEIKQVLQFFSRLGQSSELQLDGAKEWAGERRKFIDLDGLIQHGDVFVCCVLSHGEERGIYGTDGEVLLINDLLLPFNCPALEEKPKLFFIQACRIDTEQNRRAYEAARSEQLHSEKMKLKRATAKMQEAKRKKQEEATGNQQYQPDSVAPQTKLEEASPGALYNINHESDFLVAMATVDKRVANRHPDKGSLFIQSFCLQLTQGCPRGDDILTILTGVNFEVSYNTDKILQMPEVKSRLRKTLVLPVPV